MRTFLLLTLFLFWAGGSSWAQIAVFPFEDLTLGTAGINMEVSNHVAEILAHMGYQVISPEKVVTFLARHRLRWTGWSDRVTARKVEEELKAQFILLGTVIEENPKRRIFGVCARILSAPNYRLIWGQTVAVSEANQIKLLGLGELPWENMKMAALHSLLKHLPLDVNRGLKVPPSVGVTQMYIHPRHVQGGKVITCGVKIDVAGKPPKSLQFLVGKDKWIPVTRSESYFSAKWNAPEKEGEYLVTLVARWDSPRELEKRIFLTTFFVDTHPPNFELKVSHGKRYQKEVAFRRYVRIVPVLQEGEPVSRWRLDIMSVKEKAVVVEEDQEGELPPAFVWRGTDRTGSPLPNGPYIARLTVWDLAKNEASAEVHLLLVKKLPEVTVEAIAEEGGKKLEIAITVGKHSVPVTDWRFEIWDSEGNLMIRRQGEGHLPTFKIPNKKGLRYTLDMRDDFGNRLVMRNRKLKIVKAGAYAGKTKKLKRWINEF